MQQYIKGFFIRLSTMLVTLMISILLIVEVSLRTVIQMPTLYLFFKQDFEMFGLTMNLVDTLKEKWDWLDL